MAYYICRSVLPSHLVTRQAMFLQSQRFALRNSNPVLFQSLLLRSYTNSTLPSPPPEGLKDVAFVLDKYLGKAEKVLKKLIFAGLIGSTGDVLFAWCWNSYNKRKLNKTVEKGTRPDVRITEAELVPRPLITERLKKILVPRRNQSSYYVVCGEHGTGKTTLMRVASREVGEDKKGGIQGGRGVIYVDIPPEVSDVENFGKQFGKALNFTFEERISFTGQLMKKIFGFTNRELIITVIVLKTKL
jgi:Cdc6-like AAA superfamily ATPase